jgi:Transglycosylase SLT domain
MKDMLRSVVNNKFKFFFLIALFLTYLDFPRIANAESGKGKLSLNEAVSLFHSGENIALIDKLKSETSSFSRIETLYLLYKVHFQTGNYNQCKKYLDELSTEFPESLSDILLLERIRLYQKTGQIDSLLKLVVIETGPKRTPFLLNELNKVFVQGFKVKTDKLLLRQSLETLIPFADSLDKGADILRAYQNTFAENDPRIKEILVSIWKLDNINNLSENEKKIENLIRTRADGFANQILDHFRRQHSNKNYSYISETLPAYLKLLADKKHDNFSRLRKIYFSAMVKKRQFSRLITNLDSPKLRKELGLSLDESLSQQFNLWLKKGNPEKALAILKRLNALNPGIKTELQILSLAEYYFHRNQFTEALGFYNQLHPYGSDQYEVSRIKWKIWWIHYKSGNISELMKIADWSTNYQFKNEEIGARFCYWSHKLNLNKSGNPETCYSKFPLTYYGLHSKYMLGSGSEFADFKSQGEEVPLRGGKISQHDRDRLGFLKLVYLVGENKLAESVVRSIMKPADAFFLLALADMLLEVEQYYLVQVIVQSEFRSLLEASISGRKLMMPYFYPKAFDPLVSQLSEILSVPPTVILSVMREESHFNPNIESSAGAIGLMQLMPATAKFMGKKIGMKLKGKDLKAPEINLKLGAAYLRRLLKRYNGNLFYSLAAYNGGPTNVKRWLKKTKSTDIDDFVENITFTETKNYVRRVMRTYYLYSTLYNHS